MTVAEWRRGRETWVIPHPKFLAVEKLLKNLLVGKLSSKYA